MKRKATFNFTGFVVLVFVGLFTLAACSNPVTVATSPPPRAPVAGPTAPTSAAIPPPPTTESSVPTDQSAVASPVNLAVDFEIETYNAHNVSEGQSIHFSDMFDGLNPVVLNYWAGLCPPCRAEMPDFQKVYAQYQDKVAIFGLDIGPFVGLGSSEDGKALLKRLGITYPTGTTGDPRILREHPPLGMPTTFFMKPDGTVLRKWTGLLTKDKLAELIEELIKASTDVAS